MKPEELHLSVQRAIDEAARDTEMEDLAGLDAEDMESTKRPYDAILDVLKFGIREVVRLKRHTHKWNEDDYCSICGADGRA